jgi:hypothetical protein
MLILLLVIMNGCNLIESKSELPIEMIAFNSLTDEEKDLISVSPKDSIVKKISVNDHIESLIEKDYSKDQVYTVTFNHTETDSSGKLVVFVDLDKKTVVGKGTTSK